MTDDTIKSVAIIGGGVAGWMSAAFLGTLLGPSVSITLVDCDLGDDTPTTHASIAPLKAFHQMLGIQEAELLSKTQGSMKLGTQFVNWGSLGNRYFHPHGNFGAEFDVVPLHHWWLKARQVDPSTPELDDLSMAWGLAKEGRFIHPVGDRRLIQSTFDYAYHMDSASYAQFLAQLAQARGVLTIKSDISDISLNAETGFVDAIQLSDGQKLSADFYLDCSGAQRLLIKEALQGSFEDWSNFLPCDRAVSISCERGQDFSPFTRATQRGAGWQWRTPLQHQTSTGYVFASAFMSDDDALGDLFDNLDGRSIGDPVFASFQNGRTLKPFNRNVVALGDAAGFLEPLEATSLHMVQSGLTRLLALWPRLDASQLLADEYNAITELEWTRARDLLILHYHATSRTDTPLWRHCQEMAVPESLAARLAHWKASGRLISPGPELFQPPSWLSVLVGQGVPAGSYDPLADARETQVDHKARLAGIAAIISETSAQMPLHREWIDKHARGTRT